MEFDVNQQADYDTLTRELAELQDGAATGDIKHEAIKRVITSWKSWGCDDETMDTVRAWFKEKRSDLFKKVKAAGLSLTEEEKSQITDMEEQWRLQQEKIMKGKKLMATIKRIKSEM